MPQTMCDFIEKFHSVVVGKTFKPVGAVEVNINFDEARVRKSISV